MATIRAPDHKTRAATNRSSRNSRSHFRFCIVSATAASAKPMRLKTYDNLRIDSTSVDVAIRTTEAMSIPKLPSTNRTDEPGILSALSLPPLVELAPGRERGGLPPRRTPFRPVLPGTGLDCEDGDRFVPRGEGDDGRLARPTLDRDGPRLSGTGRGTTVWVAARRRTRRPPDTRRDHREENCRPRRLHGRVFATVWHSRAH